MPGPYQLDLELESSFSEWDAPPEQPKTERPSCKECKKELSSTLDAYYGFNEYTKGHCTDCRYKLKLE